MNDVITIYQDNELAETIKVRLEDESIWLTQSQIVSLFGSSKANISEHIKHIFLTGELKRTATVRKFRTVRVEGQRSVNRVLTYYNLDMIISIGYRVNSIRGTRFRIWANRVLRDYLLRGYAINDKLNRIECDFQQIKEKVKKFELQVNTSLPPKEGIFYNGQVFDAYLFVVELIKSADQSIILIDNYIDETVLSVLSKRKPGTNAIIYTSKISKQLMVDLDKYNQQYDKIEVKEFGESHDRFMIIDNKTVYHIGASLKDLGKKWFAFSMINIDPLILINKLDRRI